MGPAHQVSMQRRPSPSQRTYVPTPTTLLQERGLPEEAGPLHQLQVSIVVQSAIASM